MQDVLGLGSEARMNTPGAVTGNWSWRLDHGAADDELAGRLREAAEAAGRA
jgi:4-alpha-glucanotransferase